MNRNVAGFTLIELIATIVIIGILSAVAAPQMFDSEDFDERGYVDEVASALRLARKVAISSRCEVSVAIDAATYTARQRDTLANCNAGAWTMAVRRLDGTPLAGTAPADLSLAPSTTIIFDENGRAAGGPLAVSAGLFTITVNANSGAVAVYP